MLAVKCVDPTVPWRRPITYVQTRLSFLSSHSIDHDWTPPLLAYADKFMLLECPHHVPESTERYRILH